MEIRASCDRHPFNANSIAFSSLSVKLALHGSWKRVQSHLKYHGDHNQSASFFSCDELKKATASLAAAKAIGQHHASCFFSTPTGFGKSFVG